MKNILTILFVITIRLSFAQQLPQYSLHCMDQIVYNPAIVGSNSYPEIKLHHRSQWVGYSGAPMTSLISYHNTINNRGTAGLGGYLYNDRYGIFNRSALNLSYAHHIPTKSFYVSFGLSANIMQFSLNGGSMDFKDNSDAIISEGMSDKRISPDFSFGTFIYNQRFFIGGSIMQLLSPKMNLANAKLPLTNHYYIAAGYSFQYDKKILVEPSILLSSATSGPPVIDLNLKCIYRNSFIGGLGYRYADAAFVMLGYRFKRYLIAYSYDIVMTKLRKTNSGSHEIILAFHWPSSNEIKPLYDLKGVNRGQIRKRLY